MDARPESLPKEELVHLASGELDAVVVRLKAAQKILRRDWEKLTPGERSEHSRRVKALERQQQVLIEEIEMNTPR